MQLKRKKSSFLIVSIPIIMLLMSLTINKQQFEVIKEDVKQEIMSMNLGF